MRRLPRQVRMLIVGSFVNRLGTFIVPYLALVLRREFRLSEATVGALMMAFGAGSIVSILVGGYLTDRLGRRFTLLLSLFGSGSLAIAMAFATTLAVFIPLLVALGFLADLYRPAASALISDQLPSHQRATGFASLRMAVNLGFAFGVATGGFIADWHWRLLFLGDGLTTALYGAIVYVFISETRPAPHRVGKAGGEQSPWLDPVQLQITLSGFAACLLLACHVTALPLAITLRAGYPARVFGMLVGVNGLVIAFCEVSVVSWIKGRRRLRVAALGMMLLGTGFALTGLFLHWAWFLMSLLVWTAGEILAMPQQMAFVADWAPPAARGRYLSLYQGGWSLAFALNPIIVLPLHARLSEPVFWTLALVVSTPAAFLLLHLDRVADRPERLRGHDEEPGLV
ncbi:MAG TPA: MFS transporter, partial [Vicinamibacteria bacterium]|nr:MFS transporter [Vicinamibacteria bacterium]